MRQIIALSFYLMAFSIQLNGQKLIEFNAHKESCPNFSIERQELIERRDSLLSRAKLSFAEKEERDSLVKIEEETIRSVWDVVDGGCSWYCGGGNYKVEASSEKGASSDSTQLGKFANDFSYKSAWIEGVEGEGIGEALTYYFKNESPRITQIFVSNGIVKDSATWSSYNRVKKLKLFVNGKPYGMLNLLDSRCDQSFNIGILGHNVDKTDLVLRFEIMEVYDGTIRKDTAITEIYFNGIDVH